MALIGEGVRAVTLTAAALAPPAIALARHLGRRLRPTERVLLGLALAPFALGLVGVVLAILVRLPAALSFWQAEFVWIVIALWPVGAAAEATPDPLPERGHGFPGIAVLPAVAALVALALLPPLLVPYLRMWSDAWFHAGVIVEVARRGVPPQDPNFAGIPLYYFWFYHFIAAMIGAATGASPFHQLVTLNGWSMAVLALGTAHLTYRAAGRGPAMWAAVIVTLGVNTLGWLYWIIKGSLGETRGLLSMLAQLATAESLGRALTFRFDFTQASLLNRFWTGTALTPAIALGVVVAWSTARTFERAQERGASRSDWIRTGLLACALLAVHPAYGALALAVIALGALVAGATSGRLGLGVSTVFVLGIAFALAFPYVRLCSIPGVTTPFMFGLYTRNVWSFALAIGPWWLLVVPGAIAAWRRGAGGRFVIGAGAAAAAGAVIFILPELNSDKFFYLTWTLMAPLASAGFVAACDRLRLPSIARLTILTALIAPTTLIFTVAMMNEGRSPGVLIHGNDPAVRGAPLMTSAEAEAYQFMREKLPIDAVVIEKERPTVNEPVVVLGERRVFCGSLDVYLTNHFGARPLPGRPAARRTRSLVELEEEIAVRRSIQHTLFDRGELDPAERAYLDTFAAPLFLVVRAAEVDHQVWDGFRRQPEWDEVFANDEVRFYRFSLP